MRLANASRRPARAKRVSNRKRPMTPIEMTRLDGIAKKPIILETTKSMRGFPELFVAYFFFHAA